MEAGQIACLFAREIRKLLEEDRVDYEKLYEIRMRVGKPLFLVFEDGERFLCQQGRSAKGIPYLVTGNDLRETLEYLSGYSMYAYEEEIKQGFLSIQGGHRVGVSGSVILEGEKIVGMKYITCINIRLAHERKGCASAVLPVISKRGHVCHTLIVSPPGCGKTTMLRDIVRQISNGWGNCPGYSVGVVDERSELGGCYHGVPQNDLGIRTDILDGCPKAEGMMMLIRSMSPRVIAVDELGKEEDYRAVEAVIGSGCRLLATVHGSSPEDLLRRPMMERLISQKVFERYIFLNSSGRAGTIRMVLDREGQICM